MSNKNNERAEVRIMAEIKLVRVDYRLIHGDRKSTRLNSSH